MKSSLDGFYEVLRKFVTTYNEDYKFSICVLGAGNSLLDICKIPGASKIINQIWIPYDSKYLLKDTKAVSIEAVNKLRLLLDATRGSVPVICTGAITTNRWRKGNNHAYYQVGSGAIKYCNMGKISEYQWNLLRDLHGLDGIIEKRTEEDLFCSIKLLDEMIAYVEETRKTKAYKSGHVPV